ncbi:hypothetical protein NUACC21_47740 [Scytonema sp. NUACC21]
MGYGTVFNHECFVTLDLWHKFFILHKEAKKDKGDKADKEEKVKCTNATWNYPTKSKINYNSYVAAAQVALIKECAAVELQADMVKMLCEVKQLPPCELRIPRILVWEVSICVDG